MAQSDLVKSLIPSSTTNAEVPVGIIDEGKDVAISSDLASRAQVIGNADRSSLLERGDTDIVLRKIRCATFKVSTTAEVAIASVFSFDPFKIYYNRSLSHNGNVSTFNDFYFDVELEVHLTTTMTNQGLYKVVVDYNGDSASSSGTELLSKEGVWFDLSNPVTEKLLIKPILPTTCMAFASDLKLHKNVATVHLVRVVPITNASKSGPYASFGFSVTGKDFRGYNYRSASLSPQTVLSPHATYHSSIASVDLRTPVDYVMSKISAFDIGQHPGVVSTLGWSTSAEAGTILGTINVSPYKPEPDTALSYAAALHTFWSGDLSLTLTVTASKLHCGVLVAVFVPRDTSFTSDHYTAFPYVELDLSTNHVRKFDVRFSYPSRRMQVIGSSRSTWANFQTGSIKLLVANQLTGPSDKTESIRIVVEASACQNMELYVPRLPNSLTPQGLNDNVPRGVTSGRNLLDGCAQFQYLGTYQGVSSTVLKIPVTPCLVDETFVGALGDCYTCWSGSMRYLIYILEGERLSVFYDPTIHGNQSFPQTSKATIQSQQFALVDKSVNPVAEITVPYESMYDCLFTQYKRNQPEACDNGSLLVKGTARFAVYMAVGSDMQFYQYNGVRTLLPNDNLVPQGDIQPQGWFFPARLEDKISNAIESLQPNCADIIGDTTFIVSVLKRVAHLFEPAVSAIEIVKGFLSQGLTLFKVLFEIVTPSYVKTFGAEFVKMLVPSASDLSLITLVACIPLAYQQGWKWSAATISVIALVASKCLPEDGSKFEALLSILGSKPEPVREGLVPQGSDMSVIEMIFGCISLIVPGIFSSGKGVKDFSTCFNATFTSGKNLAQLTQSIMDAMLSLMAPRLAGELKSVVLAGGLDMGTFVENVQRVDSAHYRAQPVSQKVINLGLELSNQARAIEKQMCGLHLNPLAARVLSKCIKVAIDEGDRCTNHAKKGYIRPDPFHVMISGPPGVGKSTLTAELIRAFAGFYGFEYENNVFTLNPASKHFDGMQNQQFVVIDDAHAIHKSTSEDEDVSLIMQIKTCSEFIPPMASLEDKGRPYRAPFLITTTNVSGLPAGSALRDPDAYLRRRNVLVRMRLTTPGDFTSAVFDLLDPMARFEEKVLEGFEGITKQVLFDHLAKVSKTYFSNQRFLFDVTNTEFTKFTVEKDEEYTNALDLLVNYDQLQAQQDAFDSSKVKSLLNSEEKLKCVKEKLIIEDTLTNFLRRLQVNHNGYYLHGQSKPSMLERETLDSLNVILEKEIFYQTLAETAVKVNGKWVLNTRGNALAKHAPASIVDKLLSDLNEQRHKVRDWELTELKECCADTTWLSPLAVRALKILICGAAASAVICWMRSSPAPKPAEPTRPAVSVVAQHYDVARVNKPLRPRMRAQAYDVTLKDLCHRQRLHTRGLKLEPQGGAPEIGSIEELIYPNVERISAHNRRMHGFLIDDRRLLVNRHFVNSAPIQLKKGDIVTLQGRSIACVVSTIYWVGVDTDVAIISFVNTIPGVRSRINMFIRDAELSYAGELCGVLCRLTESGNPMPISLSKTSCALRVADLAAEKSTIFDTVIPCLGATPLFVDGFRYTFKTLPGDCGSPLVINVNSPRICGIHSGLQPVTCSAAASIVTRELIEDAMKARIEPEEIDFRPVEYEEPMVPFNDLDHSVDSLVKLVPQSFFDIHECKLELVDVLKKSEALRVGGRSAIHTSVISPYLMAFPPTRFPSIQSSRDPRLGAEFQDDGVAKQYEPLLAILNKYSTPIKPLPRDLLSEAVEDIVTEYKSYMNPLGDYEPLYYEEVINGIPGVDFFDRLNLQASPGLPFTKMGFYSKRALFAEKDGMLYVNELILAEKVLELEKELLDGNKPDIVFQEFLKDELLKPSKIFGKPNTRGIANPPLHLIMVFRKYFLGLIATIMTHNGDGEVSVGMNPLNAEEWTHFWERLERNSVTGFDADYSAFDSTQHPETLQAVCRVFNGVCGGSPEVQRCREILMSYCYDRVTQVGDVRYRVKQGLASGMPITAVGNSIVNSLYLRVAWLALASKEAPALANLESYHRYVVASTYGDDNVVSVQPLVQTWYNLKTIAAYMGQFGIGITDGAKNSLDKIKPIMPLKECTFLKRSRFRCPISNKERAVLPMDVIFNRLHYTKAKGVDLDDVRQRMVASLDDMFMYGETAFYKFKGILNTIARKVGIEPIMRSYKQLYDAWLYGYQLLEVQGYSYATMVDGQTQVYSFHQNQAPTQVQNMTVLKLDGPSVQQDSLIKRMYSWYNDGKVGDKKEALATEDTTGAQEKELQRLRDELEEVKSEAEWAKKIKDNHTYTALMREQTKLENRANALQTSLKEALLENEKLGVEKQELKQEVDDANLRIGSLRKQVADSKQRIKVLEVERDGMQGSSTGVDEDRLRYLESRIATETDFCERKQRDLLTCLVDCVTDCVGICCGVTIRDGAFTTSSNFLQLLPESITRDFFGSSNPLSNLLGWCDVQEAPKGDFQASLYTRVAGVPGGPRPGLYFNGHGTYELNILGLMSDPVVGQETFSGDGFMCSGWGRAVQLFNLPEEVGDCWVIPVLRDTVERSHNVAQAIWCTLVVRKGTRVWYSRTEHGGRDVKLSMTTVGSFAGRVNFTVADTMKGGLSTVVRNNNRPICLHFPNKLSNDVLDVGVYVQQSGWVRYAWNSATILLQRGSDGWQRGYASSPLCFSTRQTLFLPRI